MKSMQAIEIRERHGLAQRPCRSSAPCGRHPPAQAKAVNLSPGLKFSQNAN
jgi:hypothetical protein